MNRLIILWIIQACCVVLPVAAVSPADAPTAPGNFAVTPDVEGALSCTLQWINPSFTLNGSPLASLSSITILRNEQIVDIISDITPGDELSWTDTNPVNGDYTYTVYASNDAGEGAASSKTVYVGITACNDAGITVFPFADSFDEDEVCWGVRSTSSAYASWTMTSAIVRTGRFAFVHRYTNGEQNGCLFSPEIVVPSEGVLKLSFWSFNERADQYSKGKNSVIVAAGTDPYDVSKYIEIWTPQSVSEQWTQTEISLAPYSGQSICLIFKYEGTDAHTWYLDDIGIQPAH
jgi:hypothetical protein